MEPTTGLEPVTPYFDMANNWGSLKRTGSGVSRPERGVSVTGEHPESRAKQRVDSGIAAYHRPLSSLSLGMRIFFALTAVILAVTLAGCATPRADAISPAAPIVEPAAVQAASPEEVFVAGVRALTQNMPEKTTDAEILDFGAVTCDMIGRFGQRGYLAVLAEQPASAYPAGREQSATYAADLVRLASSTLC